ncbi:MAG: threonine/serine dehydratase [Alphaproteobacteria bacterium]|nr:threonine/serine dehydratase [Alphaproteobacteria bacterium]
MTSPAFDDIAAAARRIAGHAVVTPLLESPELSERVGGRLLIKAEVLQVTGSFKFRGAYARLSALAADQRSRGVVAWSSGNHAQAVAAAARRLGIDAVIVMPADAPAVKIDNTRAHGAEIVLYDRWRESREAIGQAIAAERGAVIVPPYDDPGIVAGQGTLGLELAAQAEALGAPLDHVLAPCSGGGLVAGIALALERLSPATIVHSVEPRGFDDAARSLAAGHRQANQPGAESFCDALLAPMPGVVTFPIHQRLLGPGLVVDDHETAAAMACAFARLKLVVEPGGAVALAAALCGRLDCRGRTVAVVLSGGNVDPATSLAAITGRPPPG